MKSSPNPPSRSSATEPAPPLGSIPALAEASQRCEACPLHLNATQAVFGEGPTSASLVLVGEQPGDAEDVAGRPFVGPAGALLDRALIEAGLERKTIYVTNAVKHFKWEPRGKRRIHMKPRVSEIKACRPWLDAELTRIKPSVILCLGTTAVQSLLGPKVTIAGAKNQIYETTWGRVLVTRHPSSVLRMTTTEERAAAFNELVEDLRRAAAVGQKKERE